MTTHEISTDEMLQDLTIAFPALWKRRLSEFGTQYVGQEGVWTGADGPHVMPDGDPIFNTLAHDGEAPYSNPPIHDGFEAWLLDRGWAWENYDGGTFFLLPLSAFIFPGDSAEQIAYVLRRA